MQRRFITVVLGVPIRADGRILLSQRHAPQTPPVHHKWQLIGGGVEFGETPEQTLAREFEEEAQLGVQVLFPHPVVKTSVWTSQQLHTEYETHATLLAYLVRANSDTPNWSNDSETADMRWFTLEEIKAIDVLPHTFEILTEAVSLSRFAKVQ